MEKITYGAPGYMDWMAQIKVGAGHLKVHFTGGALTSYGVTPAEYTTENPFFQKVIENSQYFRDGRIEVLRRIVVDEPAAAPAVKEEAGPAAVVQVEVDCLQDAQTYLSEHYGIPASKARTRQAVKDAAAEKGIEFVGL